MNEIIWKDIPGYEGYYQASTEGEIRSIDRTVISKNNCKYKYKGRILSPRPNDDGYYSVILSVDCVCKVRSVHRLVAITFIPNPENKATVNHKDGIKKNNHPGNLEWATRKEQVIHAYKHKLRGRIYSKSQVIELRELYRLNNNIARCAKMVRMSWNMAKHYINNEGVF